MPAFLMRSTHSAGVHPLRGRTKNAGHHRSEARSGQDQPRQHPCYSKIRRDFVKALEDALDVRFLRAWPSFEELLLQSGQAMHDHRLDQTFATSEMMQNRGMRDAHIGRDILQPDRFRSAADQTAFCHIENLSTRIRGGSTAPASNYNSFPLARNSESVPDATAAQQPQPSAHSRPCGNWDR